MIKKKPMMIYDKYEKSGDIHWQWYFHNTDGYADLVNDALKPLKLRGDYYGNRRTVLDIGCGDGLPLRSLEGSGFEVIGVDSSSAALKIAREHGARGVLVNETAEKFSEFDKSEYDYLFSLNTIEHLYNPGCMVDIMKRIKKFGIIVTDNADLKLEKGRYHNIEFNRKSFIKLFKDFHVEEIKIRDPNFIGFKITNK